jgi:hypothetical protein
MTTAAQAAHLHRPPAGKVSVGFLLNPSEAHALLLPARWTLRTGVTTEALEFFRQHTASAAIVSEGLQFPNVSFLVIAYQAADRQHRAFLPLIGRSVRCLLETAARRGLVLFLEVPDGGLAAHIEMRPEQAAAFLSEHRDECPDLVTHVSAAAAVLSRVDGLRPANDEDQVRSVCVAFILPPELVAES